MTNPVESPYAASLDEVNQAMQALNYPSSDKMQAMFAVQQAARKEQALALARERQERRISMFNAALKIPAAEYCQPVFVDDTGRCFESVSDLVSNWDDDEDLPSFVWGSKPLLLRTPEPVSILNLIEEREWDNDVIESPQFQLLESTFQQFVDSIQGLTRFEVDYSIAVLLGESDKNQGTGAW